MKKETGHISLIIKCMMMCFLLSCDSPSPNVCFDNTEVIAEKEVVVPAFTEIFVGENVALVLSQGAQSVRITASESFIDEVSVTVVEGVLTLSDDNRCDFFRESAPTTIFVSAPNIEKIRNASQYEVRSDGVLNYERLTLVSDQNEGAQYSVGEFSLALDVEYFEVISNNISNFYITGRATSATIGLYNGSGRFEGGEFSVDELLVYHRGSNKMIVHPINSIRGQLLSVGDVIAKQEPPIVEVLELAQGRLIFE